MSQRKIGILTSGGDCSGLNACIYFAHQRCMELGYILIGIRRGIKGLVSRPIDYVEITDEMMSPDLLTRSGSILLCNTQKMLNEQGGAYSIEQSAKLFAEGYEKLQLSQVLYIGGDGSLRIMTKIKELYPQLNLSLIPKTIDNDIPGYPDPIGFDTAVSVVAEQIRQLRLHAETHERAIIVEVMGRKSPNLAIAAGIASGTKIIITQPSDVELIQMKKGQIIILSEAVDSKEQVISSIQQTLSDKGIETRYINLAHIQRTGRTTTEDINKARKTIFAHLN